jgi:ABC-type transport system involved in multi-copper enzyme maturation permease subunit
MSAALRSELRKLRRTRSLLAVLLAGVAIAVIGDVLLLVIGKPADIGSRLSQYGPLRFGPSNFGLLLVVFGIRVFADETHHRTLAGTLMRTPDRRRVLGAKVLVAAASTAAFCAAVYALVVPVTVVGLRVRDLSMVLDAGATAALFGRVTVTMVLLTALGVALGAAIRDRTISLVAVVVWFALGEDLVGALLKIKRFLPGAAAQALVAADPAGATSAPVAAGLLVGFVVVAAGVAVASLRRDIA